MVCLWESGLQGSCTPRNMSSHMFKSVCLQDVYLMKNQLMRLLLTLALFLCLAVLRTSLSGSPHQSDAKERKSAKKGHQKKGNFTADWAQCNSTASAVMYDNRLSFAESVNSTCYFVIIVCFSSREWGVRMGSLLVLCSKTETGKNFLRGNFFYCR